MRRAARWDGAVPMFRTAGHGHVPPVDQVRDLIAYIRKHRKGRAETPFEIVLGGASPADPAEARETIATLAEAGVTWWDERQLQSSDDLYGQMPVLRRIDKGPALPLEPTTPEVRQKSKRDDAFVRCSLAGAYPGHLILQKDGSYRSTGPSITLGRSWRRRNYLCVYHDLKGHATVRPAPRALSCIGGDQVRNRC
jgi:hypothetical protein